LSSRIENAATADLTGPLLRSPRQPISTNLPHPILLHIAFFVYAFTVPIESLNVALDLGPISLARVSGFLAFAASALNLKRSYATPTAPFWCFSLYFCMFVASIGRISDQYIGEVYTQTFTIIQLLIFFWVASNLLRSETFAKRVLLSYAIAAAALTAATELGVPGFAQTVENYQGERLTGINANPNYLATVLALAAVILAGFVLSSKLSWKAKVPLFFMMPVVIGFLVQTGSRAGLAGFILGMSAYAWPSGLTRRQIMPIILVVLALASAGYLLFQDPDSISRWSDTLFEGDSAGRDDIYASAVSMIADRPFLGWGAVAYQAELARRNGEFVPMRDPHNLALHLLLEVGFVGASLFFLGIVLCAKAAWKSRSGPLGILPMAMLITLFVGLLFHNWMLNKPLWFVLAVCAGAGKGVEGFRSVANPLRAATPVVIQQRIVRKQVTHEESV
jgi:O-antigen ligase